MSARVVGSVGHVIDQYRRFLRTVYLLLDPSLRAQFEEHLEAADVLVRGPYVTLAREFAPGARLSELVERGAADPGLLKAHWPFGNQPLYTHQEEALAAGRAGRSFVVTTGTGSGKTESFLLPLLDAVLRRKREGVTGVQAVLLYPMNALANDQLERLRRLLRETGLPVSFALYTGDSDASAQNLREAPAEMERVKRSEIRSSPPDLLLTNFKQLDFLLVRKEDQKLFTPALRFLVLDEVHSYRGAQATEIACLIRRLKIHAGLAAGQLLGVATSATVAGTDAGESLARFVSTLFGEEFNASDVIGETLVPPRHDGSKYTPPVPEIDGEAIATLDTDDEEAVADLVGRLTGQPCPTGGDLPSRIRTALRGNAVVELLDEHFSRPSDLTEAAKVLQESIASRRSVSLDDLRREIEAYLLVGSVGDDDHPPVLRPKLHVFFHGVYDVALCLNPACRKLVPNGATICPACHSAARPAALCRTCGQDFVKVRRKFPEDPDPVGTGDFFSDELVLFLTPKIHPLLTNDEEDDSADESPEQDEESHESDLDWVHVCASCGRLNEGAGRCGACGHTTSPYLAHEGKLSTCPACRDTYTRGDIVTPLRTSTASTVSAITTHHLDLLEGEDRKALVFADNRQDVAHQAGYMADKHRTFALRHLVANEVAKAKGEWVYLSQLPETVFDRYRDELGIVGKRTSKPQRDIWIEAISYELASEVTRYSRQRGSLENLGLVEVDYEGLEDLGKHPGFRSAAREAGIELGEALTVIRAVLDEMRRRRAVDYPFFQEYIDPGKQARYRRLESEPYNVRFSERDLGPRAFSLDRPDHVRKASGSSLLGFYQENPKTGNLTGVQKIVKKVVGSREGAQRFLQAAVPILVELELLKSVKSFPLRKSSQDARLRPLQVNREYVRLRQPADRYRCNACQVFRPYLLKACPTPKCKDGRLQREPLDTENYYVHLYTDRAPQRLRVEEHSAQIDGESRAERETEFKTGKLDILVCTPTLELGVDIGPLLTIVLRGAPPTPANYVQRVGRAGRRLRIGFASTFCAGGSHDRNAFEDPAWLVTGNFSPPRLRLENPRIVKRHLRSLLVASLRAELPRLMGDLLDDPENPTSWRAELARAVMEEARDRRSSMQPKLEELMTKDVAEGRISGESQRYAAEVLERFEGDLTGVLDGWWRRVRQLQEEFNRFHRIGSPEQDERKARARRRAFREITRDPQEAYVLNYLAMEGLLPAYQFPVEVFSLDPGVDDTPTLRRPSVIAIEEFAPGNFVYANGHKLKSIRALYSGGPGGRNVGKTDAESAGRIRGIRFCRECEEATEEGRNSCKRCGKALPETVETVFVDAFEAEENLRIGADEESRQRQSFDVRTNLLPREGEQASLYSYPYFPVEYRRLSRLLVTNWGRTQAKGGPGGKFLLCPECGRHEPFVPTDPAQEKSARRWEESHRRICNGRPEDLVLAHEFQADCVLINVPDRDTKKLATLAESLMAGASSLLQLEVSELSAFFRTPPGAPGGEILIYETAPGGAGYVEELARRLPTVAAAAQERLLGHDCLAGCYLCLKHYRNQRWHSLFDKRRVFDLLSAMTSLEAVTPEVVSAGASEEVLGRTLDRRGKDEGETQRRPGTKGPQSPIEERLLEALKRQTGLPLPAAQYEIYRGGSLLTVPDFAYPDERIAIFCDGFAFHGNPETLELDASKRNWLQSPAGGDWIVLTYWGRTINSRADACAREIATLYRQRRGH